MRIGLGVIVLLVLAAALWFGTGSDNEAAVRPLAVTDQPAESVAAPSVADAEPQQRKALDTPAADVPDDQFAYRVRVVRADDEQPVAGAILRWLPPDGYAALTEEQRVLQREDNEALLVQIGKSATTDADGRATIRGPVQGLHVMVRRDQLFGRSSLRGQRHRRDGSPERIAPDTEFVIGVREDRTLTVRAIDSRSRPVPGVEIMLARSVSWNGEAQRYMENLRPTDADGLARLRHAQDLKGDFPAEPATLAAVLFGGLGDAVTIDLRTIADAPIDVRLPAFGSLDVTLFGPDGRPWQTPPGTDLTVSIKRAGESLSGPVTARNSLQLDGDGKATATPVLCGLEFDVRVWSGAVVERTITGPQRDGEHVAVELRMSADTPILTARIIDGDGAPIVGRMQFKYEYSGGSGSMRAATAADGRLRVVVMDRLLDITPTVTLTRYDDNNQPGDQASVPLRAPLVRGVNDLGDVVLAATPLLVAGRVQWTDGSAVEPPQVQVERTRVDSTDSWEQAGDLRPEHPGDGRFVVRGAAGDRRFRVKMIGDVAPRAPVEFTPGTEDLVIRVDKGASVTAHFLVDAATPWQQLRYRLVPTTPAPDPDGERRGPMHDYERERWPNGEDGRAWCHWAGLGAGPHRLIVACPGVEPPLVDLTVAVPAGAPATDPRLEGIDLRGRARAFTVTVTDALGAPVHGTRDAGVVIKGPDEPQAVWHGRALDGEDGRAALVAPQPVDVLVFVPGFRTREVGGVFADTAVTLEPIARVRLRLGASLAQLPAGATAQLTCRPQRERSANGPQYLLQNRGGSHGGNLDNVLSPSQRLTLTADGEATLVFNSDEPHQLSLLLRHGRQLASVELQQATLDPKSLPSGHVVELRIEPEALRQAIARLEKD